MIRSILAHLVRASLCLFAVLAVVAPLAAQCVPVGGKPGADKAANKAAAKLKPELRYGFQPDKEYQYDVHVEADLPDVKQTLTGRSSYRVRSVGKGQFTLQHFGGLQTMEIPKQNNRFRPGIRAPRFGHMPGFAMPRFTPHELAIDEHGNILKLSGQTQLPLLLGDLALLAIEPLPKGRESGWETTQGLVITEKKKQNDSPFPRRFVHPLSEEQPDTQRPGEERTTYRVVSVSENEVTIRKQSRMKTDEKAGGGATRESEGEGELIFDRDRGVFSKADFKVVLTVNDGNLSARVPVHVTYRLLTEEELARQAEEHKAAEAKRATEQAKEKEELAKPLSNAAAKELIAALGDPREYRQALDKLKKRQPDNHRRDIAKALGAMLEDREHFDQTAVAEAMKVWATKDNVPALARIVTEEDNVFARARAMEALAALKDKRGAEAIASVFYKTRGDARKALEEMGPVAEPYVLPLLDDREEGVRADACYVLMKIGSQRSRAKLEKLALKPRGSDAQAAREALEKIGERK
ncbi:MAG: HEAT repeat domain-containing protein [Planctomycetia bacterium]|nr:HEAT repeat domain-containing protein [Planctomycetia bacterium]